MIFRLSQKLAKKLKAGTLPALPLDENPYADWSANLFTADRTQYIILTNTQSLYSVVMYGKGIADDNRFIGQALESIREFMEADGQSFIYQRFIATACGDVQFAKALNRSVTGSMNDMIHQARMWLAERELSPHATGLELNEIPMSAIAGGKSKHYGIPREAFELLVEKCESDEAFEGASDAASTRQSSRDCESPKVKSEIEAIPMSGPTISISLTPAQRKAVAELLPEMADRLKLNEKSGRAIPFKSAELEEIQQKAEDAVPLAENGVKRKSLCHIVAATKKAIEDSRGPRPVPASERVYQFKITLIGSNPPIWRRIQVKNSTLDKLHERIQTAMGWTNSHLHQFEIGGVIYGDPELLHDGWQDETLPVNSRDIRISEIVPKDGKRYTFLYEYDFGDDWQHEVLFEGCPRAGKGERYPLCVEGERACPPEDVGGIWSYVEFLEALADVHHEQHDDYVQWAGPFDPEAFDAKKTTKVMRRGLPDWRLYE